MIVEAITLGVLVILVLAQLFLAHELRESIQEVKKTNMIEMHLLMRLEKTVARIEAADKIVAHNLSDSVSRADLADDAIPGASADAALRTGNDKYDNPRP